MSLLVSKFPRSLEARTKVLGFELGDLLLIFLYLSLSNFLFGATALRFPLVWGATSILAGVLYLSKRGKPENYLQHTFQYLLAPSVYSANSPSEVPAANAFVEDRDSL